MLYFDIYINLENYIKEYGGLLSMDNTWNNIRGIKINYHTLDLDKIEKKLLYVVCKEFEHIEFKPTDLRYGKMIYK